MNERLSSFLFVTYHYGGLGVFFAVYLSVCYVIVASVFVVETPEISEPPRVQPTAAQVIEKESVRPAVITQTSPVAANESQPMVIKEATSLEVATLDSTTPSSVPPSSSAPSTRKSTLVEQLTQSSVTLIERSKSFVDNLLGSIE